MNDVKRAMEIIDKHSEKFPEGDYLELCNILRDLYHNGGVVDDVRSIFSGMVIERRGIDEETSAYFETMYEERMRDIDITLKTSEMDCIEKLVYEHRPLRRITSSVRRDVIGHYSKMNEFNLPENTEECFYEYIGDENDLRRMCIQYMDIENQYRALIIADLNGRYRDLQYEVDRITEDSF